MLINMVGVRQTGSTVIRSNAGSWRTPFYSIRMLQEGHDAI